MKEAAQEAIKEFEILILLNIKKTKNLTLGVEKIFE